ncbi:hypothetical protein BJY04DRAFT_223291 [Aspergillus karnatakaensis]|uniref:uncharacterized protein n=1 Tax=Aspergillus karnatakaensis TaxID=1810916 RepID=UPI003CCDF3A6
MVFYYRNLILSHPEQLRAFDNCTTLKGDISIHPSFFGALVLNSVESFSGNIRFERKALREPRFEAIEMLNLPKLVEARDLGLRLAPEGSSFDLSALARVDDLHVYGIWRNASFPSLELVNSGLALRTGNEQGGHHLLTPVDLDLPLLTHAGAMSVVGDLNSLSVPKLAEINRNGRLIPGWLHVRSTHTKFSGISMPSLRQAHGTPKFEGHLHSVNLSGLERTGTKLEIQATSPVAIASPVEEVGGLYMKGPITALSLPNLQKATDIDIQSTHKFNCPLALINTFRRLYGRLEATFCTNESIATAGPNPYSHLDFPPSQRPPVYHSPSPSPSPTPSTRRPPPRVRPTAITTPTPGSGLRLDLGSVFTPGVHIPVTFLCIVLLSCFIFERTVIRRRREYLEIKDISNEDEGGAKDGIITKELS